uniref:Uncharacterized protein n=1 Tax=Strongyloides papillosus TaxID=174720 RepID=A0A0N5BUU1_STREA
MDQDNHIFSNLSEFFNMNINGATCYFNGTEYKEVLQKLCSKLNKPLDSSQMAGIDIRKFETYAGSIIYDGHSGKCLLTKGDMNLEVRVTTSEVKDRINEINNNHNYKGLNQFKTPVSTMKSVSTFCAENNSSATPIRRPDLSTNTLKRKNLNPKSFVTPFKKSVVLSTHHTHQDTSKIGNLDISENGLSIIECTLDVMFETQNAMKLEVNQITQFTNFSNI